MYVDLLLQRFQWRQRLAEFHRGALAFGAPMIFVDAIAQEHNAETFREREMALPCWPMRSAIQAMARP